MTNNSVLKWIDTIDINPTNKNNEKQKICLNNMRYVEKQKKDKNYLIEIDTVDQGTADRALKVEAAYEDYRRNIETDTHKHTTQEEDPTNRIQELPEKYKSQTGDARSTTHTGASNTDTEERRERSAYELSAQTAATKQAATTEQATATEQVVATEHAATRSLRDEATARILKNEATARNLKGEATAKKRAVPASVNKIQLKKEAVEAKVRGRVAREEFNQVPPKVYRLREEELIQARGTKSAAFTEKQENGKKIETTYKKTINNKMVFLNTTYKKEKYNTKHKNNTITKNLRYHTKQTRWNHHIKTQALKLAHHLHQRKEERADKKTTKNITHKVGAKNIQPHINTTKNITPSKKSKSPKKENNKEVKVKVKGKPTTNKQTAQEMSFPRRNGNTINQNNTKITTLTSKKHNYAHMPKKLITINKNTHTYHNKMTLPLNRDPETKLGPLKTPYQTTHKRTITYIKSTSTKIIIPNPKTKTKIYWKHLYHTLNIPTIITPSPTIHNYTRYLPLKVSYQATHFTT
jgi:hypothetical protein